MTRKQEFSLLIPNYCVTEKSTLGDLCWEFGRFLSELQKQGIGWHELPDELREIGTLNTSCGGHMSNGSRTSLRNLVVLEGLEFTRAFLQAASKGAERLNWKFGNDNPFLAELEWLDLVGEDAAKLLDSNLPLHLLTSVGAAFFANVRHDQRMAEHLLEKHTPELRARFEQADKNSSHNSNHGHYARIYLYVMSHPALEIVPVGPGEEGRALWNSKVKDCARMIRGSQSFVSGIPIVNRLRNRKKLH